MVDWSKIEEEEKLANTIADTSSEDELVSLEPKPEYSTLDKLTGAATVFEEARLAGFTPDENGAEAYVRSGKADQARSEEWEDSSWIGQKPLLALENTTSWAIGAGTKLAAGTTDLVKEVADDPLLAAKAPANIAMASLMNTIDWGKDALLYGIEKSADFYGWLTDNEAVSNFNPYSEQTEASRYSGREMTDFYSNLLGQGDATEYAKREGFYDLAGDFVPVAGIYTAGAKSIAKGSFMNSLVNKAGLPSKWSDALFADHELLKAQSSELRRTIGQLATAGVNPTTTLDVVKQAAKSAKIAGKEAAKETIAGELAVWGSHYKHDELYPEERTWKQDLAFNIGLPAALGVGLPMAAAATKTRQLFNRAADQSAFYRNSALKEILIRNGADAGTLDKVELQFGDKLGSYGLAGNQAADVAVAENYTIQMLRELKEQTLNKLEKQNFGNEVANLNDVKASFDKEILAAEKRNSGALEELVKGVHSSEDKEFLKNAAINAQDNFVNVFTGTNSLTVAPRTDTALREITGDRASKLAKLNKYLDSNNPRRTEKNIVKAMEQKEKLETSGYQLIDSEGNVYNPNNYHMPLTDSPEFRKSVVANQIPINVTGVKATSYSAKVDGSSFVKDDAFTLATKVDGSVTISRPGIAERPIQYTDSAAYDPARHLLGRQLKNLTEVAEYDKAGRPILKADKLIEKLVAPMHVDLAKADMTQVAYLKAAYDSLGETRFFKLFSIPENQLTSIKKAAQRNDGTAQDVVSEGLEKLWNHKTKMFFNNRERSAAAKGSLWEFPPFTDVSLFEEFTGRWIEPEFLANKDVRQLLAEQASSKLDVNSYFFRKPQKYVLQETNSLGALTDEINNDIFNRLAATKEFRTSTLAKSEGTLVGDVARMTMAKPMYANGYMSSPNSIAFNTDIGGKLGRYALTQEGRTEGNLALNSVIAYANEMSLFIDKTIGKYMKPLVEQTQTWIKDKSAVTDFSKFRYQSQSGWNLADAEPVLLKDGRYAFKLDSDKMAINEQIAERQAKNTNGRFVFDQSQLEYYDKELDEAFTLLPDPVTGQALTVDKRVADLLYEAHSLNGKIWEGNQAINQSLGRQGGKFRNYWMPPRDLSSSEIRIVGHEENGRFVPDIYVSGNTVEQAERAAKREMALAGWDKKREYSIKTTKEVGLEKEFIQEDINVNGFRWVDYGDSWQQEFSSLSGTGVRTSVGAIIDTGEGAVREWLESVNHNLQTQARRTRMALFSDEINQARSMLAGKSYGDAGFNELNDYIANLIGSKWNPKESRTSVYKAFDKLVEQGAQAIDNWRNLSKYDRMAEAQLIADGRMRTTSHLFESGDEVKRLYNFQGEIFDQANNAMRMISKTKPLHSKELVGAFNKVATWGLLMTANFGYAAMNLISLPAVMPMMLKGLSRQPGESARSWQARIGAWGKVANDGKTVFPDMIGAATETLNYYGHNKKEWKSLMSDFEEAGMLSTKAGLLSEAFIDPVGSLMSKGGRKMADYVSRFGIKSEEISRAIPMAMGYRLGRKIGLGHMEAMSMGRKFGDKIVGNYVASNRPALLQDGLGSLLGLFYTYNHNLIQDYVQLSLQGQKAAVATGLATQAFMFGTTSIPGADQIADLFIPLDSGKDLYGALREGGFDDTQARAFIYGFPSAITGLDFSSKGTINPSVPGLATPPLVSLAGNLWDMTVESVNQLAAGTNTNGRTLIEIMQNYLPFTAARSSLALGMGYKTDRQGRLVVTKDSVGPALWYGSNIMSMRTLDETMGRVAGQRYNNYVAHQNELKGRIRRNIQSGLRDKSRDPQEVIHQGVVDYIAAGGNPKGIKNLVKTAATKSYSTTLEEKARSAMAKQYQTPSDREWAKTLYYLAFSGSDSDVTSGSPWD